MYKFANTTVSTANKAGIPVTISEGEAWYANDEIVKTFPDFFDDEPSIVNGVAPAAPKKTAAAKK